MALTLERPIDNERREILRNAASDVASLAKQVIATQSNLSVGQRHALEVLVAAAANARRALGGSH